GAPGLAYGPDGPARQRTLARLLRGHWTRLHVRRDLPDAAAHPPPRPPSRQPPVGPVLAPRLERGGQLSDEDGARGRRGRSARADAPRLARGPRRVRFRQPGYRPLLPGVGDMGADPPRGRNPRSRRLLHGHGVSPRHAPRLWTRAGPHAVALGDQRG